MLTPPPLNRKLNTEKSQIWKAGQNPLSQMNKHALKIPSEAHTMKVTTGLVGVQPILMEPHEYREILTKFPSGTKA